MNEQFNLGELISLYYKAYLEQYDDAEMASVATAATINELLEIPYDPPDVDDPTSQAA